MAKNSKGGAKSVAKNSGQPDFEEPKKTVTGPGEPVKASGTPDFDDDKLGGNKTVKGGGAEDVSSAYKSIKQAHTDDSYM